MHHLFTFLAVLAAALGATASGATAEPLDAPANPFTGVCKFHNYVSGQREDCKPTCRAASTGFSRPRLQATHRIASRAQLNATKVSAAPRGAAGAGVQPAAGGTGRLPACLIVRRRRAHQQFRRQVAEKYEPG